MSLFLLYWGLFPLYSKKKCLNSTKKIFLASETSSNTSSNLSSVVLARQQELPFSYDTETGAGPSMAQADWNNNNNRFEFVFLKEKKIFWRNPFRRALVFWVLIFWTV